jgi:glutathione peroxidase
MAELTRRAVLATAAGALAMGAGSERLAWDFNFPAIEGGSLDLAAFKGRVLLVANTASFCGYTYQYEGLQALHTGKSSAGLTVIGVPSRDFHQESADDVTVKTFCETRFNIDFPLTTISHVTGTGTGTGAAPFYAWVRAARNWQPAWNFNKVLIARDGRIAGTFGSTDEPGGALLGGAVDAELARRV